MNFGKLKEILSNKRSIAIYDDDERLRASLSPSSEDTSFDECNVYKLDIDEGNFVAYVELPTWRVSGTITVDIEFDVKALTEDDAFDFAEHIDVETMYGGELRVMAHADSIEDVSLGYPEIEWDSAESYD